MLFSSSVPQGREKWGVGWCYKDTLEPYRVQYTLHSSTLAEIEFNMKGNRLVPMTAYIPHDQVSEEIRAQSWDNLEHRALDLMQKTLIVGDFNTALHTRRLGEEDVLGPNIYGKGAEHLRIIENRLAEENRNNIMYLLDYLRTTGSIHTNTYFEKPWDKTTDLETTSNTRFRSTLEPSKICRTRHMHSERQVEKYSHKRTE